MLCDFSCAVLIPENARRDALELLEDLAEVALRRKVDILRDLHQGEVGIHQEVSGTVDTLFVDIVLQALVRLLLEQLGQMGGADADVLCDLVQVDLLPVVFA